MSKEYLRAPEQLKGILKKLFPLPRPRSAHDLSPAFIFPRRGLLQLLVRSSGVLGQTGNPRVPRPAPPFSETGVPCRPKPYPPPSLILLSVKIWKVGKLKGCLFCVARKQK